MSREQLLSPKEEDFAVGLASGLSQAEAYRKAYPNSRKWKDATVHSRASELAALSKVRGRVAELGQKAAAANQVTVDRILAELAKVAFGNSRDLMAWGPDGVILKASGELTPEQAATVSEASQSTSQFGGSIKIKTHNKIEALKLLGEHLGMFTKKHELTGKDGQPLGQGQTAGVLMVPAALSLEDWQTAMQRHTDSQAKLADQHKDLTA